MPTSNILRAEVHDLLRYGRKNARPGKEFADLLGFSNDRSVRQAIRFLIAEGVPIASSVTRPHGYFIVNSQDEATDYLKVLKSRLVNDAYRRRDFQRAAREILHPSQMELF